MRKIKESQLQCQKTVVDNEKGQVNSTISPQGDSEVLHAVTVKSSTRRQLDIHEEAVKSSTRRQLSSPRGGSAVKSYTRRQLSSPQGAKYVSSEMTVK